MSATIVSNEIIFFNPYPISSHERCDTEDFDEKGEEEVLSCTYLGFKLGLLAIKIRNVIELEELDIKKLMPFL